ncbi:hypothetical protein QFC20_003023 [Naganishia adeliensis]|uniref:Uncharacterized protein n=1 Tax=Naganishia adeliensis TaxID=92952 RepID=A0ACC2WH59_9TREE|nr:hypothetical protein QFC20_003023 [Naganishia adeliensis]
MSSQLPRLSDNRLHPYSQLSQSPVSPNLLARDSRSGAASSRLAIRARLDQSAQSIAKQLSSPVIRPQQDRFPTDEMPSPLSLPAQYANTPSAQPLKQVSVNQHHPRPTMKENGIGLSGLNDKLGFHVPARETITPRGSDDEGEDLLMFPRAGRNSRSSNARTHTRNSRSLCIEEKARGRRKHQEGETTAPPQRKAFSEQPFRVAGLTSPSERRGRSRDIKPCSRSTEAEDRLPVPQATVQSHIGDALGLDDDYDTGAFETATVETMLSSERPFRPSSRLRLADDARVAHRASLPGSPGATSPRMLMRSTARPAQRYSRLAPRPSRNVSDQNQTKMVNGLVTENRSATTGKTRSAKDQKKPNKTSNPMTTPLAPPKPFAALSEKSSATVVKDVTNVFAPPSPVHSIVELTDADSSAVSSVNGLQLPRRSASISLKRIQDQDLENILGSSAIRIPSPMTSPRMSVSEEAQYNRLYIPSEEIVQVTVEPAISPQKNGGPLHRLRDALPTHKGALPKARALPKIANPGIPRPVRSLSHQILSNKTDSRVIEDTSGSLGRSILKRSRTASTATVGGDQKRVYTRWDGVETPITKEGHPVHWEMLQNRQQLREQGSKASPKHNLLGRSRPPTSIPKSSTQLGTTVRPGDTSQPPSPHAVVAVLPSRVVSLTSLAHHAVSSLTRPVSHRHKSAPLRVPSHKSTGNIHQDIFGEGLRSSFSQESSAFPSHESLASSFDSKVAYKACKKEEGYVNFDKVLGLDNHASREEIAGMVGEGST